jgi:hypothetical protein
MRTFTAEKVEKAVTGLWVLVQKFRVSVAGVKENKLVHHSKIQ